MSKDPRQKRAGVGGEAADAESRGFVRGALSVFILFHLIAITCWVLPTNVWPVAGVKELVRPYMLWTGLFQSWDTFGPNPVDVNSYVKAVVVTRNRKILIWAFPRMEELGFAERYRKERYRKFVEVMQQLASAPIWPDIAKHVARMFNSPADPPDKVFLIQYVRPIKPGADEGDQPALKSSVFYEGYVQPEDLK
jgi:hypothetical protein